MKLSVLIPAVISILSCLACADPVLNGGFEEALDHWVFSGCSATDVNLFIAYRHYNWDWDANRPVPNGVRVTPVEGGKLIFLRSGGGTKSTSYSQINQVITLNQGELIRGKYFFATDDYIDFNDFGVIKLIPSDANQAQIQLGYESVNHVGDFGSNLDWVPFSHVITANEAGTYTLQIKVADCWDCDFPSYFLVDALAVLSDANCNFMLDGDVDGDCKVNLIDLAVSQNLPDGGQIKYIDALARNWLIDCSYDPNQAPCVPW